MKAFPVSDLINLAAGQRLPEEPQSRPERLRLAVLALFAALALAALWGVLAGLSIPSLALTNALRIPVVVLLGALAAVPPGMLAWKLGGSKVRGSGLLLAFTSGTFTGTLVMAALSPVVALYYHSSNWAGPILALGSVAAGVACGLTVFFRRAWSELEKGTSRKTIGFPLVVFAGLNLAALMQLIALAGPMLPERTAWDKGIDGIFHTVP